MKFEADKKEDLAKLRKAFIQVLNNVKDANKSSSNPFTKSKYANLTDANNAAEKALADAGFGLSADVSSNGDTGFVSVTNHFISEFGQIDFETLSIPTAKKDAQGYGSAITYARRYALNTNLNISVEDDDGNAASYNNGNRNYNQNGYNRQNNQRRHPQQKTSNNQPPINPAPQSKINMAIQLISTYASLADKDEKEMIQASARKAHVNDLKELNEPQVDEMINGYTKAIELMNDKEGVK